MAEAPLKGAVQYEKRTATNGTCVAVLSMDNAPVNALSAGVRTGLDNQVKAALKDSEVKAIVVTGKHGAFCAGADISEFSGGMKGTSLLDVMTTLESSPKPVVAAIDGVCLGGGCETALACHYRLASKRSQVGLPEVNLGLLPGAHGTQRCPRCIGLERSIDFMCSGMPLNAAAAAKAGLFDDVIEGDNTAVLKGAIDFAASKAGQDMAARRLSAVTLQHPGADAVNAMRKKYGKLRAGEVAPQAIITCIEAATKGTFQDGIAVEGAEFAKLFKGDQAKALQYFFFAERQCSKIPDLTEKPGPLNTVGIIGSGLMGGGIGMCCAEAGMKVKLLDVSQENLDKGMAVIKKNYAASVQRKSKTQEKVDKILSLMSTTVNYSDLADCDIVVEAVFENMKLKKDIFGQLDAVCKPGCILASNTSRLNIDEIAAATKRPQDVVGCHFFSPANVMKLLENVRGAKSSPRTIATAMEFGKRLKKVTCLVGNCDGFIANRTMGVSGAGELVADGSMPFEIDAAAEAFGMRMGPFRMQDLVGLDLFGRERANSGKATPETHAGDAMYALKRFGQKSGKGFYKYDEKRKMSRDPEAEQIIETIWKKTNTGKKQRSKEEMVDRLYLPVVNEGFKCLEEGIAIRPSDIDVCLVYGYNWPRFRGGPMQWATSIGLPKVLEGIEKLGIKPSGLLKECVEKGWSLNSKDFQKRCAKAWSKL
eukprot:TRINITY_DN91067_c0_g1_i1.p1 TRINITY_DN91067_c0_g1~~TRINITY_DN91067_c0_g1_i1.p1  ORF type:complete len:706 (+),score=230.41 TRINITY_DN91067_c0_g1_i1:81-2198(+)